MKYRPVMSKELLMQYVTYSPASGVLTRTHAVNRNGERYEKQFTPRSVTKQGYRQISMFKRPYLVHRLVWLYMTGCWPVCEIDHINGDRLDNRWCNLRDVSAADNRRNMGIAVNNKSGCRGVYWYPRYKKWEVTIQVAGEHIFLGRFVDYSQAVAVRKTAEKDHGFHPNHGERDSWVK